MVTKNLPLIMRSGFLVSYKRTLPIIYLWLGSFLFACHLTGVLGIALADFEVYASWILWPAIVLLNKNMITGFQNLFNIFSDDDMKHSNNLNIFGKADDSIATQKLIEETFTKTGYDKFKENAISLVFNPKQKIIHLIGAGLWIPVLFVVYTFYWSFDLTIYGVPAPELLGILHLLSMVYILILLISIMSMAWLLYSIMVSVHKIKTIELKITKTIPILRNPVKLVNNEIMSFNEFRERIVIVGQFLYSITLRITGILVLLVMADILRDWFLGFDLEIGQFIIGGVLVLCTSLVVYVSQMGLHLLLSKSKDEFILAIQERKFKIDIEIQRDLDQFKESISSSYSSARYDAVNRLDILLQEIQPASTWAIKSVNTAKVFSVSIVPLVASILPLLIEKIFF